jgi:hypothetical protein
MLAELGSEHRQEALVIVSRAWPMDLQESEALGIREWTVKAVA